MAIMNGGQKTPVAHVEDAAQDHAFQGPVRSSVWLDQVGKLV